MSISLPYTSSIVIFMGLNFMIFHYVISHNSPKTPGKPDVIYLNTEWKPRPLAQWGQKQVMG